jgi:hypothetical protein
MRREVHVRFCERLEMRSLGPTLPHIGGTIGTKGEFVVWRKGRIKE